MTGVKQQMAKSVAFLAEQLRTIRSGTLDPGLIQTVRVTSRGASKPIAHLASSVRQGDRIILTPFDKSDVPAIVKALSDARLNAYALNPTSVSVSLPPISGEQRVELARHVKKLGEDAKLSIRAIRQSARQHIASTGRGSQKAVQEATDASIAEIDRLVRAKTVEIGV